MNEMDDAALVARCLQGDAASFEKLLERYQRPVFNIALRMVRDREDARDVAQSVFVKAYENLGSYDPRYRFFSWLYRIAMNESLNQIKKQTGFVEAARQWFRAQPAAVPARTNESGPEAGLRQALMNLKPEHRCVIVLKHLSGYSYRDVGEILGIPEKTVRSRLFEARRILRQKLSTAQI